jgi:hypothetical protein
MTEHIEHKPGLHCHHDVLAVECTLCTYVALERRYNNAVIELIKRETGESTQGHTEEGEAGGSAGLDGAAVT